MTTTNQIVNQSVGTGANVGSDKFPQKVTLDTASVAAIIELKLTNGVARYDERQDMRLYYAFSTWSVTDVQAPGLLRQQARYISLVPGPDVSNERSRSSPLEPAVGQYLYLWLELPNTTVASLLSVNVTEI